MSASSPDGGWRSGVGVHVYSPVFLMFSVSGFFYSYLVNGCDAPTDDVCFRLGRRRGEVGVPAIAMVHCEPPLECRSHSDTLPSVLAFHSMVVGFPTVKGNPSSGGKKGFFIAIICITQSRLIKKTKLKKSPIGVRLRHSGCGDDGGSGTLEAVQRKATKNAVRNCTCSSGETERKRRKGQGGTENRNLIKIRINNNNKSGGLGLKRVPSFLVFSRVTSLY